MFPNTQHANLLVTYPIIIRHFNDSGITNISYSDLTNSMSCVYIFFNNLEYTHTEEIASIDLVSLIANMGGTLGLFTGI